MESLAMKQQIVSGQQRTTQVTANRTYARKELADMPVLVVESVADVEKLTAMMKQIRGE